MSTAARQWYQKWSWYGVRESKEERRLLLKQDCMILAFGCLTFFTKVGSTRSAVLLLADARSFLISRLSKMRMSRA